MVPRSRRSEADLDRLVAAAVDDEEEVGGGIEGEAVDGGDAEAR